MSSVQDENEKIDMEYWDDYGNYRIFKVQTKWGMFYKAVGIGDDPADPVDSYEYARHPMRAVAFLMKKDAEELIKNSYGSFPCEKEAKG